MERVVVKIGGSLLSRGIRNIVDDVKDLNKAFLFVLVHGGASEVTKAAEKMGKKQMFVKSVNGFRSRYTDRETMDIFRMVMGKINDEIVLELEKSRVKAVGLSGVDGRMIVAKRKEKIKVLVEGRRMMMKGDYTGKITEINSDLLNYLLNDDYLPVISPIALSQDFEFLNVDADRLAANIAGELNVKKLVLLTDVDGLTIDDRLIRKLSSHEIPDLLNDIGPGMRRKVFAAYEALNMGVEEILIASGLREKPVSSAFNHQCTVVGK